MRFSNLQTIVYRLNVLLTGIVFMLLSPTVRVYAWWFPDKKNSLWLFPVLTVIFSCFLWLMTRLSIPFLIRLGILRELRKQPRAETSWVEKMIKIVPPILICGFHLFLVIFFSASLISFMQSGAIGNLFLRNKWQKFCAREIVRLLSSPNTFGAEHQVLPEKCSRIKHAVWFNRGSSSTDSRLKPAGITAENQHCGKGSGNSIL